MWTIWHLEPEASYGMDHSFIIDMDPHRWDDMIWPLPVKSDLI